MGFTVDLAKQRVNKALRAFNVIDPLEGFSILLGFVLSLLLLALTASIWGDEPSTYGAWGSLCCIIWPAFLVFGIVVSMVRVWITLFVIHFLKEIWKTIPPGIEAEEDEDWEE